MRTSDRGVAEIMLSEAAVINRYKDSKGIWTIGVGHTKYAGGVDPAKVTRTLSFDEVMEMFSEDLPKYEKDVNNAVKVPVTQYEFDAMVSFHFNTGGIGRAQFVKDLNAGKSRATVAAGFMNWSSPPEIVGRRNREMELFRTGKYTTNPRASVYPASTSGAVQWSKGVRIDPMPGIRKWFPSSVDAPTTTLPILRRGSKGPEVAQWQSIVGVTADGDFGPNTEKATKSWQATHGLVNDGIVGPRTWTAALG